MQTPRWDAKPARPVIDDGHNQPESECLVDDDHCEQQSKRLSRPPWQNQNHKSGRPKRVPPRTPRPARPNQRGPPTPPPAHDADANADAKAKADREAMMRYLIKNHPRHNNWENWDIRVECRTFAWFLHRNVLAACPFFAALFPPPGPRERIDNVLPLHGHVPEQLANVFHFMYKKDYPGADFDKNDPIAAGACVLTNTAMYLAGASVDYQEMMQYAARKIEAWSTAVLAPGDNDDDEDGADNDGGDDDDKDSPLVCAIDPLRRALCIVYDQPPTVRRGLLLPLRLALVRFIDAALPVLATSAVFRTHFCRYWVQPLRPGPAASSMDTATTTTDTVGLANDCDSSTTTLAESVALDHALFQELGMLHHHHHHHHHHYEYHQHHHLDTDKRMRTSWTYVFNLLHRLAKTSQQGVGSTSTSTRTDNTNLTTDGDGRADRGARGDRRDCPSEQARILSELDESLRGVYSPI